MSVQSVPQNVTLSPTNEILFLVEEALEGGYTARALGYSIFTEADTWDELKAAVQDAVRCHFDLAEHLALSREALLSSLFD
jgi:hypothetical protein